jgi:hypothetical protein
MMEVKPRRVYEQVIPAQPRNGEAGFRRQRAKDVTKATNS